MSNVPSERIRQACETINDAIAAEAAKLEAEGFSTAEAIGTVLASLTCCSANALKVHVEMRAGALPEFLQGLQRFAQQMADHGLPAYQSGKRPLQ